VGGGLGVYYYMKYGGIASAACDFLSRSRGGRKVKREKKKPWPVEGGWLDI